MNKMSVCVRAQKQVLYSWFWVIIRPEQFCGSYESPIFMGQ